MKVIMFAVREIQGLRSYKFLPSNLSGLGDGARGAAEEEVASGLADAAAEEAVGMGAVAAAEGVEGFDAAQASRIGCRMVICANIVCTVFSRAVSRAQPACSGAG